MHRFATVTGGALAAAALLTAASATARQSHDPMTALREAPAYDALHPADAAPATDAVAPATDGVAPAAQPAAAAYDPMAAASRPQGAAVGTMAEADGSANPELGGLPNGSGAEETYYQCVACHSTAIIKQQRITDARWDDLWHWMVEEQGMVEPDDETKALILGYLKQHFSSER